MKPLVLDLFCGLFGWGEAFADNGYDVVGFDLEDQFKNFDKKMPSNCELVLRDIRSITGVDLVKEYGVPTVIVCSPPCQRYSWMAMPWLKAKKAQQEILDDKTGEKKKELNDLFNQCFRIQREVSEACGHYVPMIVENVRGAQKWVGKAKWNFGSFYLWCDVPALMPIPAKSILKYGMIYAQELRAKNGSSRVALRDGIPSEGNKTVAMNWSDQSKRGQDFTRIASHQAGGYKGVPTQPAGQWTNAAEHEDGTKGFKDFKDSPIAALGSKSKARKRASAEIAKIPPALAAWIAKVFKPGPAIAADNNQVKY